MKTTLLLTAILFTVCVASLHAQSLDNEAKLNYETRKLANKLGLNEFACLSLKRLNREKAAQTQRILDNYSYDPALKNEKLVELDNDYDLKLRAFLRLRPLQAYLALKGDPDKMIAQE